jgi:hypothetical protein
MLSLSAVSGTINSPYTLSHTWKVQDSCKKRAICWICWKYREGEQAFVESGLPALASEHTRFPVKFEFQICNESYVECKSIPCSIWDALILKHYSFFNWKLDLTGHLISYIAALWDTVLKDCFIPFLGCSEACFFLWPDHAVFGKSGLVPAVSWIDCLGIKCLLLFWHLLFLICKWGQMILPVTWLVCYYR